MLDHKYRTKTFLSKTLFFSEEVFLLKTVPLKDSSSQRQFLSKTVFSSEEVFLSKTLFLSKMVFYFGNIAFALEM